MAKILLLAVVVAVAWWLLRRGLRSPARRNGGAAAGAPENMVRCAHCGVHLPRGESIESGDRFFCSREHERDSGGAG